ncbi:MAG: YbiU family protein [Pseudomonadota bacterium]|nr:YbiU family protein [Pseudomonadota bacterium]
MSETMTAEFRDAIREAKAAVRDGGTDVAAAFAGMDMLVEAQIRQIEAEVAEGVSPVPVCDYGDVAAGRIDSAMTAMIKQRGAVILRNTFERERVALWNDTLMEYVARNDYFEKQKARDGMDQYFSNLSSSRPQIFGLYWSKPQMEARSTEELATVRKWLNRLWSFNSENGTEFDPDRECLYADRLRQREPGDDTLGLSPHVDGGSVERWLDQGYRSVYRHLLSGAVESYDPFDAAFRTVTREIPSPAVCSMFRTYQGWTALSRQGPGDGTLNLVPIANAMGWVILRALQDDVPEDELCGAAPSRALTISEAYHAKLLRAYVPIPVVEPGDTVWWHPDVIHGVEDHHTGSGYSNVMYIGAAPACAKNERFLAGQRRAFEAGESSPDFAAENYEVDFEGRFTADMLSPLGRLQMGYDD